MSRSINGWPVIESRKDLMLRTDHIPGSNVLLVTQRDVWPLFAALAADYADTVAPLRAGECFGWAYRTARQSAAWSDHASGTAIDLNSAHEGKPGPAGGMVTMSPAQVKECSRLKRLYRVLIWGGDAARGGDYHDPRSWDPMHYAIRPGTTRADIRATIERLKISPDGVRATRA